MNTKSPFLVYQDFLSPKQCDIILDNIKVNVPNTDQEGLPASMTRYHDEMEDLVFENFKPLIPDVCSHYGFTHKGTEKVSFHYYPEGMPGAAEEPHSESSVYARKKWVKAKDRDVSGILWLKDFNDTPPVDLRTEVYGGKLEFPQYNFSLQPQRGTLILFPSGPHFINAMSQILVGDLYLAKIHVASNDIWFYDPRNFPGTYIDWFKEYA